MLDIHSRNGFCGGMSDQPPQSTATPESMKPGGAVRYKNGIEGLKESVLPHPGVFKDAVDQMTENPVLVVSEVLDGGLIRVNLPSSGEPIVCPVIFLEGSLDRLDRNVIPVQPYPFTKEIQELKSELCSTDNSIDESQEKLIDRILWRLQMAETSLGRYFFKEEDGKGEEIAKAYGEQIAAAAALRFEKGNQHAPLVYAEAVSLVSERPQKSQLIDLVNFLLVNLGDHSRALMDAGICSGCFTKMARVKDQARRLDGTFCKGCNLYVDSDGNARNLNRD